MDRSRREFIKAAGLSLVGAGCGASVVGALKASSRTAEHEGALAGKRWAMVVDIAKCRQREGCRDCIQACHALHNVPAMEDPRHEIKWIWKETFEHAFPMQAHGHQTPLHGVSLLVLCNHCDRPSCVRVCPTRATWKRGDGLVMMDQHRCIGCRYCIVACPYGSRSFNFEDPRPHLKDRINLNYPTRTKGVVEKCSFCAERLAVGGQPACVEACPAKALIFGDLGGAGSEVGQILRGTHTIRRKPNLGTEPHVFYVV